MCAAVVCDSAAGFADILTVSFLKLAFNPTDTPTTKHMMPTSPNTQMGKRRTGSVRMGETLVCEREPL